MPDLAPALAAILAQVRRETEHGAACHHIDQCGERQPLRYGTCICDFQERVEAEQARRWAVSIEAASTIGEEWTQMTRRKWALEAATREASPEGQP